MHKINTEISLNRCLDFRSLAPTTGCCSKRHFNFFFPILAFSILISTPKFLDMKVSLENITAAEKENLSDQQEYMPVPTDIYSNIEFQFWYHIILLIFLITIPILLLSYLNYKIFLKLNQERKVRKCQQVGNSQTGFILINIFCFSPMSMPVSVLNTSLFLGSSYF